MKTAAALLAVIVVCAIAMPVRAIEFTPVRRTTIVTADMDASLAFYRDLLDFVVEWDVSSPEVGSVAFFPPGTEAGRAFQE